MNRSEAIDKIYPAIFAVKKELEAVKKTSANPFFKSNYANLNTHLEAVEPLLEKYGCMVLQPPHSYGAGNNISETQIIHVESGQFISGSMSLEVAAPDMQKLGAASTYARRFVLSGLLSMLAEDDDGNTASGKVLTPKAPATEKQANDPNKPKFAGFKPTAKKEMF